LNEAMEQQMFKMLGELKEDVGELKAETKGINNRLDKLNGSVGRHEEQLIKIRLSEAQECGEKVVKKSILSKFWDIGKVPISLFLGAGCGPIIQKFGELVGKLVGP
jgi:dynactin complex subunit